MILNLFPLIKSALGGAFNLYMSIMIVFYFNYAII